MSERDDNFLFDVTYNSFDPLENGLLDSFRNGWNPYNPNPVYENYYDYAASGYKQPSVAERINNTEHTKTHNQYNFSNKEVFIVYNKIQLCTYIINTSLDLSRITKSVVTKAVLDIFIHNTERIRKEMTEFINSIGWATNKNISSTTQETRDKERKKIIDFIIAQLLRKLIKNEIPNKLINDTLFDDIRILVSNIKTRSKERCNDKTLSEYLSETDEFTFSSKECSICGNIKIDKIDFCLFCNN